MGGGGTLFLSSSEGRPQGVGHSLILPLLSAFGSCVPPGLGDQSCFLFPPAGVLGAGIPLPKLLNIDFDNADIDVIEVGASAPKAASACLARLNGSAPQGGASCAVAVQG